jgi:N-terminal acetyltransferase B complex catalytic subunit
MTTIRRFKAGDLFKFNQINLDPLTETYSISSYLNYLAQFPNYFQVATNSTQQLMGYVMGKAEGDGVLWHGHVTALTVSPVYRRMGLAKELMLILEKVTEIIYNGYFVDLFVRSSNAVAIGMYNSFGYTIYRTVLGYYTGPDAEDGYGKFRF